ncbi:hypothetical protein BVRB_3g060850 [Beta vulgaris subsp. vulgaris]|nr:hypothetical protein BVRB_3g060850 [Beta vulgaris subsp. vulgaris]
MIFSFANINYHSCKSFSLKSPLIKKSNSFSSSFSFSISKPLDSTLCYCRSSNSSDSFPYSPSSSSSSSLSPLQQFLSSAAQAIEDFANLLLNSSPKKDEVLVRYKLEE